MWWGQAETTSQRSPMLCNALHFYQFFLIIFLQRKAHLNVYLDDVGLLKQLWNGLRSAALLINRVFLFLLIVFFCKEIVENSVSDFFVFFCIKTIVENGVATSWKLLLLVATGKTSLCPSSPPSPVQYSALQGITHTRLHSAPHSSWSAVCGS